MTEAGSIFQHFTTLAEKTNPSALAAALTLEYLAGIISGKRIASQIQQGEIARRRNSDIWLQQIREHPIFGFVYFATKL